MDMLDNYEQLPNGIIRQVNKIPFTYGYKYSHNYTKLLELGKRMSYLRLGFLLGSIGRCPKSILDIGYGSGDFLEVCKEVIPKCYGSDVTDEYPLPEAVNFVELRHIYNRSFDVVCLFDVLEHFDNIYDIGMLDTNYIYVSLPCCVYKSDEWFSTWKHRKPNEHLWFFDQTSLCKFFDEIGFEPVAISDLEDIIRKDPDNTPNILTGIFKRR